MTLRDECVCHLKTLFVFFTCYFDRTFVIAFATPYFMLNVYKPTNEQTLKRLNTFYGPRQVKRCLQTCAKCIDSSSFRACAKSQPGISYPLIHSIMSSNSVSGRRRPLSDRENAQADLGLRCPQMLLSYLYYHPRQHGLECWCESFVQSCVRAYNTRVVEGKFFEHFIPRFKHCIVFKSELT